MSSVLKDDRNLLGREVVGLALEEHVFWGKHTFNGWLYHELWGAESSLHVVRDCEGLRRLALIYHLQVENPEPVFK